MEATSTVKNHARAATTTPITSQRKRGGIERGAKDADDGPAPEIAAKWAEENPFIRRRILSRPSGDAPE